MGISDVLVVVVRYFGGIKLGIPGLIRAYKTSTSDALSNAQLVTKVAGHCYRVGFDYSAMNAVMKVLKDMDLPQGAQDFGTQCSLSTRVRLSQADAFLQRMEGIAKVEEIL